MLRNLFAVLTGAFATMIVVSFSGLANARLFFPPPASMDWRDPGQVSAYSASLPPAALVLVLLGWLLGAFAGAWVASRLAEPRHRLIGLVIGALVTAGVIHGALTFPHPIWMTVLGVLLPLPLAWVASRQAQKGLASTR